jgi:hypothetical protein
MFWLYSVTSSNIPFGVMSGNISSNHMALYVSVSSKKKINKMMQQTSNIN